MPNTSWNDRAKTNILGKWEDADYTWAEAVWTWDGWTGVSITGKKTFLLTEESGYLLLEDGSKIILTSGPAWLNVKGCSTSWDEKVKVSSSWEKIAKPTTNWN